MPGGTGGTGYTGDLPGNLSPREELRCRNMQEFFYGGGMKAEAQAGASQSFNALNVDINKHGRVAELAALRVVAPPRTEVAQAVPEVVAPGVSAGVILPYLDNNGSARRLVAEAPPVMVVCGVNPPPAKAKSPPPPKVKAPPPPPPKALPPPKAPPQASPREATTENEGATT